MLARRCSAVNRLLLGEFFFFQAEDGIRDLVRSRGLGDVYKRQDPRVPAGHRHRGGRGRDDRGVRDS